MFNKSQIIHDEVVKAMVAENVDPFERPYRPNNDTLVATVTANSAHVSPNRAQMKNLRDFSKNLKFVEAKSMAKMNHQQSPSSNKSRKRPKRKAVQDVRRPFDTSYCSIFPLPTGTTMFDGQVCYAMHPISKLLQEMDGLYQSADGLDSPAPQSVAMSPVRPVRSPKNAADLPPVSPLKPARKVRVGYGDIGNCLPGGLMGVGPARPVPAQSLTQNCDMPTSSQLDGGLGSRLRAVRGGSVGCAQRFPRSVSEVKAPIRRGLAVDKPPPDHSSDFKGKFSSGPRFSSSTYASNDVGPGSYNASRLFDDSPPLLTAQRAELLIAQGEDERGLKKEPCKDIVGKAVFGYGCNFDEHAKYGMCLDGMCGRRGVWEEIIMVSNDESRLAGTRKKDGSIFSTKDVLGYSKQQLDSGDTGGTEQEDFSPLKSATLCGDLDSIIKLCALGVDINEVDKWRNQCVLHLSVQRNYWMLLRALTGGCGGWDVQQERERNPFVEQCIGLFQGVINLNIQNKDGDTALHLAARQGAIKLVDTLCDGGAEPVAILNKKGESPVDIAKDMQTFQMLKMYCSFRDSEKELAEIQKQRQKSEERLRLMLYAKSKGRTSGDTPSTILPRETTDDANCAVAHAPEQSSRCVYSTEESPRDERVLATNRREDRAHDDDKNGSSEVVYRAQRVTEWPNSGNEDITLSSLLGSQSDELDFRSKIFVADDTDGPNDESDGESSAMHNQKRAFGRGHSFEVGHLPPDEEPCQYDMNICLRS